MLQTPEYSLIFIETAVPDPLARPYSLAGFPPSEKVHFLLKEYLIDFNQALPLADPSTLIGMFRAVYSHGVMTEMIHQANVWTVLAIAHRLRGMSPLKSKDDNVIAKSHLHQAIAILPSLLISKPSTYSIQCLVGMAIVIHGIEQQDAGFSLLAAALRMAEAVAATGQQGALRSEELEQYKQVYWIAIFMDTDCASDGDDPICDCTTV